MGAGQIQERPGGAEEVGPMAITKGIKSIFKKLSKNEQKQRTYLSTKAIKLPKNFAEMVLNEELKIDAGQVDLESVNRLLQMYSVSHYFLITYLLFSVLLSTTRA